jgi:hypothetical protein
MGEEGHTYFYGRRKRIFYYKFPRFRQIILLKKKKQYETEDVKRLRSGDLRF